ncbi:hypothetical protein BV394_00280 [Brevirhabdus pacifica]|uniref:Uncharacterized protein n=1 Tax=Brevirhabdus pacifica TaxID=1267768 RepID=A0A1U7DEQ0_9RHOB|nr:cytochrome c biogenesis protein CcdA [Brevirhabdus pacifica]APX88358.1 hypothetical protein BV394_00280 [Brevirhabdus pacifica]OWU79679.1 hypothetical protein ATO5_00975 [Loktanella sp. 22II-4b]PJJ87188.1 cytochrome c-type biogenesis protein [Brevirhabdus pacifica]
MDFSLTSLVLLPAGLGLLGFVEPCTIGAHMLFVGTQTERSRAARGVAFAVFLLARVAVMALFGALVALVGAALVGVQTGFWLVFGLLYLAIGGLILSGRGRALRQRIPLGPRAWRLARNPALQGAAFGLNIPACAAPLIFAMLGVTAGAADPLAGALAMGVFAAALSLPLLPMLLWPPARRAVGGLGRWMRGRGWLLGLVFIALGLWSIWFGLYVDPAGWSGL